MDYVNLRHLGFGEIDICDPFFDSLKADYDGFEKWFAKKADNHEDAYVQYNNENSLQGFLYIKMEKSTDVNDVNPRIEADNILKIGTFKIEAHGTKMGEQFLKVVFDFAVEKKADVCYLTVFEKHQSLIDLLKRYGFKEWGTKGVGSRREKVLLRDMRLVCGDVYYDYPLICSRGARKYLLSIYPKYHSQMFPKSILTNESRNLIKDISYTNSIQKNYVCSMQGVDKLHRGDLIVLYRTAEDGRTAEYSAVATTVCTVTDVRSQETFDDFDEFYRYTSKYTVFERKDLEYWYRRGGLKIISMVYNCSFKRRIVRHDLIERIGLPRDIYWGFFELADDSFERIIEQGQVLEYFR